MKEENKLQETPIKNLEEHSRFIIERFDHYYDSVNNKGNFYLAFNAFVFTALVAYLPTLLEMAENKCREILFYILIILTFLFLLASTLFILFAIFPYSKSKSDNKSLIYFEDISSKTENNFSTSYQKQSEEIIKNDLTSQIYYLSKGLTSKFKKMEIAGWFILAEIITSIACVVLLNLLK